MDEEKWKNLEALITGLDKVVKAAAVNTRTRSLADRVTALQSDFASARASGDATMRDHIEMAVQELWANVERWSGVAPKRKISEWLADFSIAGLIGLVVLLVVLGLLVAGIMLFTSAVGWKALMGVDGTRPILTVAAIIATLAYGGGLIFSALYSNEGKFEERFRMAREIFLVFSGVFATIVGFHFGAGNNATGGAGGVENVQQLELDVRRGAKPGELELSVTGGTPPYTVTTTGANIKTISPAQYDRSPIVIGITREDPEKSWSVSFSVVERVGTKKQIEPKREVLDALFGGQSGAGSGAGGGG